MFGKNKISPPQNHSGDHLNVQEIFPTLQGEGPYVGMPAIFIRLGGCNLACSFCDTEFESYKKQDLEEIIKEVKDLANEAVKLIVITGGEPLIQPIEKLCQNLINSGFLVQIETNGTLYRDLPSEVKIICSPKVTNGKYHRIRPDLLKRIDAFKFIISSTNPEYADLPDIKTGSAEIFLQPMDEYDKAKNQQNTELAMRLCIEGGSRLSIQTHKILGID